MTAPLIQARIPELNLQKIGNDEIDSKIQELENQFNELRQEPDLVSRNKQIQLLFQINRLITQSTINSLNDIIGILKPS